MELEIHRINGLLRILILVVHVHETFIDSVYDDISWNRLDFFRQNPFQMAAEKSP